MLRSQTLNNINLHHGRALPAHFFGKRTPAQGDEFLLIGRVIKPGRTLFLSEGRAFAITKGESKLIATMTATNMALYGS